MTKELILRAYLEDDLFVEKNYLKEGNVENYKWATPTKSDLIEIIKIAIEGEMIKESSTLTERKINTLINRQS
jgi:hypothetical protein